MAVDAKICGVTRPGDAAFAASHGAWRLGVVFARSPRRVSVTQAREIVDAAGGVPVLGVFDDIGAEQIVDTIAAAGLAGAQWPVPLAAQAAMNAAPRFEQWRVIGIDATTVAGPRFAEAADGVDAVLVEALVPGGAGGRGCRIPAEVARRARELLPRARFVLAGGLTPDVVGQAIRLVQPDVVDVSSGVESSPGIKDRALLTRFLENVFAARAPD